MLSSIAYAFPSPFAYTTVLYQIQEMVNALCSLRGTSTTRIFIEYRRQFAGYSPTRCEGVHSPVVDMKVHWVGSYHNLHSWHEVHDAGNGNVCLREEFEVAGDQCTYMRPRDVAGKFRFGV